MIPYYCNSIFFFYAFSGIVSCQFDNSVDSQTVLIKSSLGLCVMYDSGAQFVALIINLVLRQSAEYFLQFIN